MSNTTANVQIDNITCEYGKNPIGLDSRNPRFSWTIKALDRGAGQSAFQLIVKTTDGQEKWNTGKVYSSNSINICYEGKPLVSRTKYIFEIRIRDNEDVECRSSGENFFETAILNESEWKAKWIRGENLFRKSFEVKKTVVESKIYISGLGYYELRVNGEKIGDHVLDPSWTDYDLKAFYVTYDVTDKVKFGSNGIGVMLGNGRYSPYDSTVAKNWHPLKKYGPSPVLFYQQHIYYDDGSEEIIFSDTTWKTDVSPIIFDDIYDGEHYDARLEQNGWDQGLFNDSKWKQADLVEESLGKLVSQGTMPVIKVMKKVPVVKMTQPAPNVYLYDFGQNFSGWVRLKVIGEAGTEIKIHFAELKDEKTGMLNPNTNRGAEATDIYICKGGGVEFYEPHFTYHGFRYVELSGYPGTPSIDSIEARVVHTSVERIGSFYCSNELINKIHSNYIWTQVSNYHSVPTDCCQRDERMGWVGDAQLSSEAAAYNFDVASFYSKFTEDIKESQLESGSVAGVSPPYWRVYPADPTYATACVEFPWVVSRYNDDKQIIEQTIEMMAKWVDFLGNQADEEGVISFGLFGDWCPPMHANPVDTPFEITSTWYYAHDALVLSIMADRVGNTEVAQKYYKVFEKASTAFNTQFLKGDRYSASKFSDEELAHKIKSWLNELPPEQRPAIMKRYATLYSSSSQTSNLLPLYLGIVPEENIPEVLQTLVQDLEVTRAWHINTGVVGLKYIFDVLIKYGYEDLAYKLITQDSFPSFGYQILKEGATTLWERWEYLNNDKVFNSHSHPFTGSVDVYFYKYLAGIGIDENLPGFKNIILKPVLSGDLGYASASVDSVRGRIVSNWSRSEKELVYKIEIPGNTTADVFIPKNGWESVVVTESGDLLQDGMITKNRSELSFVNHTEKYLQFKAVSGNYTFQVKPKRNEEK